MNIEIKLPNRAGQIEQICQEANAAWTGCDWPVEFSMHRFQLQHMTSSQCQLMARATAGSEAESWWEAASWLARIEHEARAAGNAARAALDAMAVNQWDAALTHARIACDIEARYHTKLVWQQLRDAIEREVNGRA